MTTVQEALEKEAKRKDASTLDPMLRPTYELVCETLFRIASNPSTKRGGITKARQAQKIIFDRLAGTRVKGTAPAQKVSAKLTFLDLTISEDGVLDD